MNEPKKQSTWTERQLRTALEAWENELRAQGKARNTINTYVQHPERFINWLVRRDSSRPGSTSSQPMRRLVPRRSKYGPLREHLAAQTEPVVMLSFAQIEAILGTGLPASARRYAPWWANEDGGTHVQARSWMDANRRTRNVDINEGRVEFVC